MNLGKEKVAISTHGDRSQGRDITSEHEQLLMSTFKGMDLSVKNICKIPENLLGFVQIHIRRVCDKIDQFRSHTRREM